jgi:glutathionyl-hydroquinone reductase
LEFCGITSKANAVIKSHLNDRYQRGLIDNRYSNTTFSGWGLVKQGIPQGQNLGPLFFFLYINDLPKTISNVSKPVLFAENTSIIVTNHIATEFTNDINTVLGNINDWFRINLLPLNFQKNIIYNL